MGACSSDDVDDIALHSGLHTRLAHVKATASDRIGLSQRSDIHEIQTACVETGIPVSDDLGFVLSFRVVDQDFQQKSVELRFGQWVSALVLDRILGGEHCNKG